MRNKRCTSIDHFPNFVYTPSMSVCYSPIRDCTGTRMMKILLHLPPTTIHQVIIHLCTTHPSLLPHCELSSLQLSMTVFSSGGFKELRERCSFPLLFKLKKGGNIIWEEGKNASYFLKVSKISLQLAYAFAKHMCRWPFDKQQLQISITHVVSSAFDYAITFISIWMIKHFNEDIYKIKIAD